MLDYQFSQDPTPGFVGFFDLDTTLKAIQSDAGNPDFDVTVFPFYNIHSDNTHYMLDISVPGYASSDMTVKVVDGVLHVTGNRADKYDGVTSVWNGDTNPLTFTKSFRLFDTLVVDAIKHVDGILTIKFLKLLPDLSREGHYPIEFVRGTTPMIDDTPPAPVVDPTPAPVVDTPPADSNTAPVVDTPVDANTAPVDANTAPVDDAPVVNAVPTPEHHKKPDHLK